MTKRKFIVTGMTCSACSSHVERAVGKLDGVKRASVNLLTGSMTAEYDESKLGVQDIVDAVVKAGYGAEAEDEANAQSSALPRRRKCGRGSSCRWSLWWC